MNKPEEEPLGFLLADVSRLMRALFQRYAAEDGLTLAQARALLYLSRSEGMRQVELADQMEVQPMTLVPLIDQLVNAGLVERRIAPQDRRAYQLFLTPKAAPIVETISRISDSIRASLLSDINKRELATTTATLRKIRTQLVARYRAGSEEVV